MSNRLIQYGFTAGIVSKTLWGQTILQKYGYGLADCRNYIVHFSGMLISRPGTIAGRLFPGDVDQNYRLVPFIFAEEDANTFQILFLADKIFFLQQGAYQLEAAKSCTAVIDGAGYTEFTCTAHGYSVGEFIEFYGADVPTELVGQTVVVSAVPDANTFRVQQIELAADMDGWADAATSAVDAHRVYSITTTYGEDDLDSLYFHQTRDVIYITSRDDFAPAELERLSDGTWTLTDSTFGVTIDSPPNVQESVSPPAATNEDLGCVFVVTSLTESGEESLPSVPRAIINGDSTMQCGISWDAVAGAIRYNIYRSIVITELEVTYAMDVGYVATSFAPVYYHNNIIPDFTKTPPINFNPFSDGAITDITVNNAGSGYSINDDIVITDSTGSGTGARAQLLVDSGGRVIAVQIIDGGKDYETPVASFPGAAGTGAAVTITTRGFSGNSPGVSGFHQQRKLFASSVNDPLAIWGSHIGLFDNFSRSRIVAANESYEYEPSSPILGQIQHLVSTRTGLLVFTNIGIWVMTGSQTLAITPTDVDATVQTSVGASSLLPLHVDSDIVYAEVNNKVVRLLQYDHRSRQYGGIEISILAHELLEGWHDINTWSFETRPYKLIWSARNDGQLLSTTISQEQEVFAWARHDTEGEFEQNITVPETDREVTYVVTKRYLNGRWIRVIEYFADRTKSTNADHCGVDCATQFGGSNPAAKLTFDGTTFTASAAVFASGDVGKFILHREGKAVITSFTSSTEVDVTVINEFTSLKIPYSSRYKAIPSGEWELIELLSDYKLPLNFRPTEVTVFGDGKVATDLTVAADGTVTFPEQYAFGYIGFGFECLAVTLPFAAEGTIVEDSRKNIVGAGLRFVNTKGIEVGTAEDETFPIPSEYGDFLAEASKLRSGHEYVPVSSDWDVDSQIYIKANGAYPTQVTALVIDLEVGDEVG